MKNHRQIIAFVSLLVLLISITWTDDARAGEFDRRTVFTVNQPLRVPGNIILPPGKYVMKLMDGPIRDVVSITDAHEKKVYTTFFAVPQELPERADAARIVLGESPRGAPEQVKAWYYPGLKTGLEFPTVPLRPIQQASKGDDNAN
jgi:hypothetical protein